MNGFRLLGFRLNSKPGCTIQECVLQDGEQMCRYRIVQDGLPLLLPYVTRQALQPTVQEFLNLIEGRSLYVPEEARAVPADAAAAAGDSAAAAGDSAPAAADGASVANDVATDQEVKLEAEDQSNKANAAGQLAVEVSTDVSCFVCLC